MKRVLAIAWLTFSEGVRMRIVLVFLVVLAFLVLRMPFALRGDETLTGRLQSFLAYSLAALSLLLSLATVFFSCATLTTEIKERSLHLVVTKPVSRFQILAGKWLGVNILNLLIVLLCSGAIYGFARFIRSRPEQFARDRLQVRDVVWTARVAASPNVPSQQIAEAAAADVQQRVEQGEVEASKRGAALGARIAELMNQWRTIASGEYGEYEFRDLIPPEREDTVVQIRYKARAVPTTSDELVPLVWAFYDPQTGALLDHRETRERSGDTHEFLVRAGPAVRDGRLLLRVFNPMPPVSRTSIHFEGADSLQVLYKMGSFELNFVKAVGMILLQLALLSAIGLFFSVFVSFPVACLCTSVFYLICILFPFIFESIGANLQMATPQIDPYGSFGPAIRRLLVPFMTAAFPDFSAFNGARYLIEGRYITPGLFGRCFAHTLLYGGALLLLPGWLIFRRREIAEVTV